MFGCKRLLGCLTRCMTQTSYPKAIVITSCHSSAAAALTLQMLHLCTNSVMTTHMQMQQQQKHSPFTTFCVPLIDRPASCSYHHSCKTAHAHPSPSLTLLWRCRLALGGQTKTAEGQSCTCNTASCHSRLVQTLLLPGPEHMQLPQVQPVVGQCFAKHMYSQTPSHKATATGCA